MRAWLLALLVAATALPACAQDKASFSDLLARARAQAAAGHRWSPPGDNMTETIASMMDLVPTATPQQLADLSALLESDAPQVPAATTQASAPAAVAKAGATQAGATQAGATQAGATKAGAPAEVAQAGATKAGAPAEVAQAGALASAPAAVAQAGAPQGGATQGGAPDPTPGQPAATAPPAPIVATIASPVAASPGPRAVELFVRGQQAERQGDFSGARRFYAAAAGQGSAKAARSLGRLYDPGYLKRAAIGGIDPDPALARHWYERAVAMGDSQAAPLLQALAAR